MKNVVERLLAGSPGAKPEYFEVSPWFSDVYDIGPVIEEHTRHFKRRLAELAGFLGPPGQTDSTHRSEIGAWYPEAIRAACWNIDGKTICLAVEQHDKETPVAVLLRCLSDDEISDLSG